MVDTLGLHMNDETLKPDEVQSAPADEDAENKDEGTGIREPSKLIRIASMTRAMLDEVREASLDEGGRSRIADVHQRSLNELREVLSPDLVEELDEVMLPISEGDISESEIRIAQAQLIGWLEGLFHGIQASIVSQQVAAQHQVTEMQRQNKLQPPRPQPNPEGSGMYL